LKTNEENKIVPVVKNYAMGAYRGIGDNDHLFFSSELDSQLDGSQITSRMRREFLSLSEYKSERRNAVLECNLSPVIHSVASLFTV
jgi:hypothetical protein